MKVIAALCITVVIGVLSSSVGHCAPVNEPWGEIEARTKFLRTDHYIDVVRVQSSVYQSASAKGGVRIPGPFPVHVILPKDYDKNTTRRYGAVYLLGGKSGWDNGPERGGAVYWSVWCKTPLTMDNLKSGKVSPVNFQDNITPEELDTFNKWLAQEPYDDLIAVCLWNPGGGATAQYEKYLIDEVIPFVDAHYRTVPDRRFRGIDGACAGAAQGIMIACRRPDVFAYAGGQQTDLGSYPMTPGVFQQNIARIRKAGGIAFNINTNVKDGCNTYSNGGRLYGMVEDMKSAGFPVTVNVFKSCPHGYCAYRYPNGHQALLWFSNHFKRNFKALGMNLEPAVVVGAAPRGQPESDLRTPPPVSEASAKVQTGPLPGLW
jgi:hypothetical protein